MSWLKLLLPQLRWGAGPKGIPFHTYFLDHVIRVPAVQREREFVTEKDDGPFFEEGRLPGDITTYAWSIDEKPAPLVLMGGFIMSGPMQRAFDEAVKAWGRLRDDLIAGRRTAIGTYDQTGARRELAAAEWRGSRLSIDIRTGEIFERSERPGVPSIPRWRSIEILPPQLPPPPPKRNEIDWEDLWTCVTILHERGELPRRGPGSTKWAKKWIKDRYSVTLTEHEERELRRHLQAAREVATERPKSTDRKRGK
jgi:hypothetical protein